MPSKKQRSAIIIRTVDSLVQRKLLRPSVGQAGQGGNILSAISRIRRRPNPRPNQPTHLYKFIQVLWPLALLFMFILCDNILTVFYSSFQQTQNQGLCQ